MLKRLPRLPLCRPEQAQEVARDILSSLKDHLWWRRGNQLEGSRGTRACWCSSILPLGQSLPERKAGYFRRTRAHQDQGGPSVGTGSLLCIRRMIERLRQSTTRMRLDVCHHSQSWDQLRRRSQGQSQRHHRAPLGKAAKPSSLDIAQLDQVDESPSGTQNQHLKKTKQLGSPLQTLIWGSHQSWWPDIEHFLQESAAMHEEKEGSNPLQEPQAKEYKKWIVWRGYQVHTTNWWQELVESQG